MNIGQSIDKLYSLREEKRELKQQIKEIDETYSQIESNLISMLQEQEMDTGKSKLASATISTSIVPAVDDWEAFYGFIVESNQPFLLERRPSVTAYRDLLQAGEEVPGVSPFTKVSLSLRKI
jgi:molecular chaperone GrpE (heat shock protein)